jgi:hypothetical protein
MTAKKQSTKKGGTKSKAGHTPALERLTAERIRNILSSPGRRGKRQLQSLCIDLFGEDGGGCVEETPEYITLLFEAGASGLRDDEEKGRPATGRALFEQIVALAEKYEPDVFKLARRVSEIYAEARERGDREDYIMRAADEVTTSGGEGVMLSSPASEFFVPFFVEAVRDLSPKYRALVEIKNIVARYDAGMTLREMVEEEEARGRERAEAYKAETIAKPEPKDKTSDEWRYWKLRRIEAGFTDHEGSTEKYAEAWREFREFFHGYMKNATVESAVALLPTLITAHQRQLAYERQDRRRDAGRRGAQTRKAKGRK